jgi:hypothetical protein
MGNIWKEKVSPKLKKFLGLGKSKAAAEECKSFEATQVSQP